MKQKKKKTSLEDKKKTITAFILTFPALIVGFMAIAASVMKIWFNVVIVALLILQFVLIEQFIKDYYKDKFISKF